MGDKNTAFVDRGNVNIPRYNNCNATYETIIHKINESNRIANENSNNYPIQEQATLLEIWKQVPRQEGHELPVEHTDYVYVLRSGLDFEDVRDAHLRTFVSANFHNGLINALDNGLEDGQVLPKRVREAYTWLRYLQKHWERLYKIARNWRHSLFYEDFVPREILELGEWDFPINKTIYQANIWNILFPDICVPYNTASRRRIIQCIRTRRGQRITYVEMLKALRSLAINLIIQEGSNVAEFRRLDQPGLGCPYDSSLIALPRPGFDYGNDYTPEERPISRVIDKYFYHPG